MTKVFIWPTLDQSKRETGIGRIVIAQHEHLPAQGIQLVSSPHQADVIACHTQRADNPRVDVLHCHGMYFIDVPHAPYSTWHGVANQRVAAGAREALVVTVPSEWVAEVFRRDMRLEPTIIGHGVELDGWDPLPNGGYVLWNKNRSTDVCDPSPALKLAQLGYSVVSTFAPEKAHVPSKMKVTGSMAWTDMRELVRAADVYLATTPETFGVGTLEAMAAGVPVLGYRWAGTADLVRHDVEGYLVDPEDVEGLAEGLDYIHANRQRMSEAARSRASEFTWEKVAEQYAGLYRNVANQIQDERRITVSVVIPSHDYATFLPEAVASVLEQSRPADEIIIVDDGSTDETPAVVATMQQHSSKILSIRHEQALGVAASRNEGIAKATSQFIVCLDADDFLDKRYIELCLAEIVKNRGTGITYTGLRVLLNDSGAIHRTAWPPEFSWDAQTIPHVPPNNCVPSASMFRKAMWSRAGGFKQQYAPGEDAEFWTRGLASGFTAKRVTDLPMYTYRVHAKSASRQKRYVATDDHAPWVRDKEFPLAAPVQGEVRNVRSYSQPLVSVLIGRGKVEDMIETLDDLLGQRLRDWEAIVVGKPIQDERLRSYPWLKWGGSELVETSARGYWLHHVLPGNFMGPDFLFNALRKQTDSLRSAGTHIFEENKAMGKCCGGDGGRAILLAKSLLNGSDERMTAAVMAGTAISGGEAMRLEFIGTRTGAVSFRGKSGKSYRGGNNVLNKYADVLAEDVAALVATGMWRPIVIQQPAAIPEENKPVEAALAAVPAITTTREFGMVDHGVPRPVQVAKKVSGKRNKRAA